MPIDTLKAAKRLKELGFDDEQSEGMAELFSDLDVASATKEDLDDLEDRLRTDMEAMEERLTQRVELSEERLGQKVEEKHAATVRTVVASVAAVGAVLAIVIPLAIYLVG